MCDLLHCDASVEQSDQHSFLGSTIWSGEVLFGLDDLVGQLVHRGAAGSVPFPFVFQQVVEGDATVRADAVVGYLTLLQQVHEELPGHAQIVRRRLRGEGLILRDSDMSRTKWTNNASVNSEGYSPISGEYLSLQLTAQSPHLRTSASSADEMASLFHRGLAASLAIWRLVSTMRAS